MIVYVAVEARNTRFDCKLGRDVGELLTQRSPISASGPGKYFGCDAVTVIHEKVDLLKYISSGACEFAE